MGKITRDELSDILNKELQDNVNSISTIKSNLVDNTYFTGLTIRDKNKPTKGIVTFISDDASRQDYTIYKPLFKSLGVNFCTAVITSSVGNTGKATLSQLLEIQADGNEILSHSHTHPHLSELSDADSEVEFANSKNWLITNGFDVETFAIPYGYWGEREKAFAKKYYRASRCSDYGLNGLNESPIETYELKSIWLDSSVVIPNDPSGFLPNTIEYYQYYIDKAFANNSWLIIGTHSWDIEAANLTQLLTDVINYAKTKCDILTVKQALNKVGNIIDTGSFGKAKPYVEHFSVGYDGKINTNNLNTVIKALNAFNGTNHIDDFKDYQITENRVDTATATSSGLPESLGGVLYTYKVVPRVLSSDNIYNYQIYHVLSTGNIYKRICNSDRSFVSWKQINNKLEVNGEMTTLDNGISTFNDGITINYLMGAYASISPTKTAGTLLTCKVSKSSNNAFSYQEFSEYNGRTIFRRFPTSSSAWGSWIEIGSKDSFPVYDTVTGSTSITSLAIGITYNTVLTATAASSGLPESLAGTLITYKIHATDHAYNYQTYHIYGTAKLYKRSFASDGTPTAWTKISAI